MYNGYFGLHKNPFNMTPDPAFLFMTPQHREALVGLTYAILQRKGFVALTGEAGTGKTTLLARVLQSLPASRLQFSVILNPTLTAAEFLEMALLDFGITQIPTSKAQRLWKLQSLLFDGQQKGKISALIVDEAQKLSPELLEEIRLLGNFEDAEHKLLQILLVGQRELDDHLNRPDLRQLKQRIALRLCIGPLAVNEVGQYIQHRWTAAGGADMPFSAEGVGYIAKASGGIPRVINSLCENALTQALGAGVIEVQAEHAELAAMDLNLAPVAEAVRSPAVEFAESPVAEALEVPEFATSNGTHKGSLWTRWAGKFGLTLRDEAT